MQNVTGAIKQEEKRKKFPPINPLTLFSIIMQRGNKLTFAWIRMQRQQVWELV